MPETNNRYSKKPTRDTLALKREIILRAYRNGAVFEWEPPVAANLDNFYLLLQILGERSLQKIWQKWSPPIRQAVLRALLGRFSQNFEEPANTYAREAYLLVTGDFKTAVFGDGRGAFSLLGQPAAARFGRDTLHYLFQRDLTLEQPPAADALTALARGLLERDMAWLGFVIKGEFRRRLAETINRIRPPLALLAAASESWIAISGEGLIRKRFRLKGLFIQPARGQSLLALAKKNGLTREQVSSLCDVLVQIELGVVPVTALNRFIAEKITADETNSRLMISALLKTHLAPLRALLPGVDQLARQLNVALDQTPLYGQSQINPPATAEATRTKLQRLPLRELLEKYPKLRQQILTSQPISVKGFSGAVKPTLGNWLKDYRYALGIGQHENVQRGEYLYRSENGKGLTESERAVVSYILKAYDTNSAVPFNPISGRISLGRMVSAGKEKQPVPAAPKKGSAPEQVVDLKENS